MSDFHDELCRRLSSINRDQDEDAVLDEFNAVVRWYIEMVAKHRLRWKDFSPFEVRFFCDNIAKPYQRWLRARH
jgi:hypothetical protein